MQREKHPELFGKIPSIALSQPEAELINFSKGRLLTPSLQVVKLRQLYALSALKEENQLGLD